MTTDTSKIPASRLNQKSFDAQPQSGSDNIISSCAVYSALEKKLGATDTAARASADASGNIISETYAKINDVIFYEETN